jgi:hypothetical protein
MSPVPGAPGECLAGVWFHWFVNPEVEAMFVRSTLLTFDYLVDLSSFFWNQG